MDFFVQKKDFKDMEIQGALPESGFFQHCVKYTIMQVLSGPHNSVFRLNKGTCGLTARIL